MDDSLLLFSNAPLQPSQETVTLAIVSEDRVLGAEDPTQRTVLEGQITLNPHGRIFFLPPLEHFSEELLLTPDRSQWDLYLVYLPFTLHPASGSAYYEELTFFIDLQDPQASAHDLFPAGITREVEETRRYTLSPHMTFQEVTPASEQVGTLQFEGLQPTISAFGKDEHLFYWIHQGFQARKTVTPETKHAAVILKIPAGTSSVDGKISYQVRLGRRRTVGGLGAKKGYAKSVPVHWALRDAPSLFHKQNRGLAEHVDVCIVCALAEEAQACIREIERLCAVTFKTGISARSGEYRFTTIRNTQNLPLSVRVSWQFRSGPLEAGLHLKPIIEECTPYVVAMTGICAGNKRKANLGDLIVAISAFASDTGKIVRGADGNPHLQHDLETWNASPDALQCARMLQGWEADVREIARPTVGEHTQPDAGLPAVHIASLATLVTVRSDNPFEEICQLVRNTVGLDMEAVAFYRAVADFPGTRALLVKGVSDFADGQKNDEYHPYASAVSAVYMLRFIQEFLHTDRFSLQRS